MKNKTNIIRLNFRSIPLKLFIIIIYLFMIKNVNAAISEKFKFAIDTIGIPEYNIYGEQINEDIYYTYNIFVYSNPNRIAGMTNAQRFKQANYTGKWTKYNGKYQGYGIRGEYNILGMNYIGSYVYNPVFPMDGYPETTPDKWTFIYIDDAYDSWDIYLNKLDKYQVEYMKNADMLFEKMTYYNYINNIFEPTSYGITANKIGLNKVKLHTCSTWKTSGVLYANRRSINNKIYYATFMTEPMAANAEVSSILNIPNNINIGENEDYKNINISFGAKVINLTDYAKKEHIKNITSVIYIDNKEVSRVSGSKTYEINKQINYAILRDSIKIEDNLKFVSKKINIKIKSFLYTEFTVDGLLENEIEKEILINFTPKKLEPFKTTQIKVLKKEEEKSYVSPLIETKKTKEAESFGIIEANRYVCIKTDINIENIDKENLKTFLDEKEIKIEKFFKKNNNILIIIKIPKETELTIKTWSSVREMAGSYFDVDFNEIGQRIRKPHKLKISYELDRAYSKTIDIDTIDDYEENINYLFKNGVINKEKLNEKISIENYLEE